MMLMLMLMLMVRMMLTVNGADHLAAFYIGDHSWKCSFARQRRRTLRMLGPLLPLPTMTGKGSVQQRSATGTDLEVLSKDSKEGLRPGDATLAPQRD